VTNSFPTKFHWDYLNAFTRCCLRNRQESSILERKARSLTGVDAFEIARRWVCFNALHTDTPADRFEITQRLAFLNAIHSHTLAEPSKSPNEWYSSTPFTRALGDTLEITQRLVFLIALHTRARGDAFQITQRVVFLDDILTRARSLMPAKSPRSGILQRPSHAHSYAAMPSRIAQRVLFFNVIHAQTLADASKSPSEWYSSALSYVRHSEIGWSDTQLAYHQTHQDLST
jgi:hypothetical protein